jgi:hypothetical protein
MANCRACGAPLNPQERFCGYCGAEQPAAPQVVYSPMPARAGGGLTRAAMGLGIAGGLLGILWGALGPYLTYKWPNKFLWGQFGTGIKVEILLVIGLVLGLLGIVGGVVAPKARGVAAVILIVCGLVGFLVGTSWLVPGALLLTAGGLAIAGDRG